MAAQPQLVMIEWIDGARPSCGWQPLAEAGQSAARKCVSVGFLLEDGDDAKILAPNLGAGTDDEWDEVSGLMRIPSASIVRIKHLSAFALASAPSPRRPLADAPWLRKLA